MENINKELLFMRNCYKRLQDMPNKMRNYYRDIDKIEHDIIHSDLEEFAGFRAGRYEFLRCGG